MIHSVRPSLRTDPKEHHPVGGNRAKRQVEPPQEHPPLLEDQLKGIGRFGYFNTPQQDHYYYFNPGVVDYLGKRRLVCRRSFLDYGPWQRYTCDARLFEITEDNKLKNETPFNWPKRDPKEQIDDPRASVIGGKLYVSVCSWKTPSDPRATVVHQSAGIIKPGTFEVEQIIDLEYGGNHKTIFTGSRMEKNWLWFDFEGRPHIVYMGQPHTVLEVGDKITEHVTSTPLGWNHGDVRGGTPPVLVGDLYWTFFHSSVLWKRIEGMPRNRYFSGAYAFESKPPFKIKRITENPLIAGTLHEPFIRLSPPCVFPVGALLDNGNWFVTLGVNDCRAAWMEISHDTLLSRTKAV